MTDYVLLALTLSWWFATGAICWKVSRYVVILIVFHWYVRTAPDCCMCGADHPNQCTNHSYLSQKDWYLQGHHPQAY